MINKIIAAILTCGMMESFKKEMRCLLKNERKNILKEHKPTDDEVVVESYIKLYRIICILMNDKENK